MNDRGHWESMRGALKDAEASWDKAEEQHDPIEKPSHYSKDGGIECIDYMKDNMDHMMFMGYLEGCAKKYGHRFRYKGKPVEDLKKQVWYLNRLIKEMEGE